MRHLWLSVPDLDGPHVERVDKRAVADPIVDLVIVNDGDVDLVAQCVGIGT